MKTQDESTEINPPSEAHECVQPAIRELDLFDPYSRSDERPGNVSEPVPVPIKKG